ncbi:MAG: hypothetical protein FWD53_08120 [Phycisphaerales bacterium]|nr:hypothetical protein [Phycisphaerales bacterium]
MWLLSFLTPYVKVNVKHDSPLVKAFDVFNSQWDSENGPTWGATRQALEQWFKLTDEQRKAILNGWNPHEDRPTNAEAFYWIMKAEVKPVLHFCGQDNGRIDIAPEFVPEDGTTDPVKVEFRQGTSRTTAVAVLRSILEAVEKHFDQAIQFSMDDGLVISPVNVSKVHQEVESALQSVASAIADAQKALHGIQTAVTFTPASSFETKKPQTVSKTSPKLGGEEKKTKAAAAR